MTGAVTTKYENQYPVKLQISSFSYKPCGYDYESVPGVTRNDFYIKSLCVFYERRE